MASTFRTDCLATKWAVFDGFSDIVGAVAVVERAHNFQLCFTTAGAWSFIDNMVAGVAFVPALFNRNILKSGVFFLQGELFRRPVHGNILSKRNDKSMGVPV